MKKREFGVDNIFSQIGRQRARPVVLALNTGLTVLYLFGTGHNEIIPVVYVTS